MAVSLSIVIKFGGKNAFFWVEFEIVLRLVRKSFCDETKLYFVGLYLIWECVKLAVRIGIRDSNYLLIFSSCCLNKIRLKNC
jgi:hypothetical protein